MSSLFGSSSNKNTNTTAQTVGQDARVIEQDIIQERAPIVNEQHVYTQAQQAPEIREKHVVREQHLVQEVPVIEKKVIHERPVIQEKTVVHEKPIVHEKKVITNEQQVVREQPLVERQADQFVRESPTIIRDQTQVNTNTQHNTLRQDEQNLKNDVENKESKPGFFGSLFGGAKHEENNLKQDEKNLKNDVKNDAHLNNNNQQQSGGMLKNLFSSNVPRPFATTTYDYGTAGSTTVAASVPASDMNTTATLPQGPIDNQAAFTQNNKISSA